MGQYKFSMYLNWQIGFMVIYNEYSIDILLPFVSIYIATDKHAKGFNIFDIWISQD